MIYAERAYFDGDACAHCAAWEEHKRLERIRAEARRAYEGERRRNGRFLARAA